MAIAAKLSAYETQAQVATRFSDKFLEARLINAPGVTYTPDVTDDSTFLANEATIGSGGYQRQIIKYEIGDVAAYGDDGVALAMVAADTAGHIVITFVSQTDNASCSAIEVLSNPASLNPRAPVILSCHSREVITDPLTKNRLYHLARQEGWDVFSLSGGLVGPAPSGVYLVGTKTQGYRKVTVMEGGGL